MAKKRGKYKSGLRGYASYSRLYRIAKNKAKREGYEMNSPKMSKSEYLTTYEAEKNDRLGEIERGERKTVGDINRTLVQEQTFEYSQKQAKAFQTYYRIEAEMEGDPNRKIPTQSDIRKGKAPEIDFDTLKEIYHAKKEAFIKNGLSLDDATREAKDYVSSNFFGSP